MNIHKVNLFPFLNILRCSVLPMWTKLHCTTHACARNKNITIMLELDMSLQLVTCAAIIICFSPRRISTTLNCIFLTMLVPIKCIIKKTIGKSLRARAFSVKPLTQVDKTHSLTSLTLMACRYHGGRWGGTAEQE